MTKQSGTEEKWLELEGSNGAMESEEKEKNQSASNRWSKSPENPRERKSR